MGDVNINIANGRLGSALQTSDGVVGLIMTGAIDGYTLGQAYLFTSLASAVTAGVDKTISTFAYKQIKEFYDEAGTGAKLYCMFVPNTVTLSMMTDHTSADYAVKLLNYAQGKIRVIGFVTDDPDVYGEDLTTTHGINDDVLDAKVNAKLLALDYFSKQQPIRVVIGGTSYQGVPGDLQDQTTDTNNRTAILIGDTQSGAGAAVGLLLGRIAKVHVMRKVSRVRDGSLLINAAYLGTTAIESIPEDFRTIMGFGFITLRQYPNKSGYFFSGDETCSSTSDDYHFLARGRVIDKAHIITYATYVEEVDDELLLNDDGTPDSGVLKTLEQSIENAIGITLGANKEISSVTAYIDPTQVVAQTNTLNVNVGIVPVGYSSTINIDLGFKI